MLTGSPLPGGPGTAPRVPSTGSLSLSAARITILVRSHVDRRRLLGMAVAAVVAGLVLHTVTTGRAVIAELGETRPVVVAIDDLEPGHVVTSVDVTVELWPVGLVPTGSAGAVTDVAGRTVRSTVLGGEAVVERRAGPGRLGLDADERALTLPRSLAPPPLVLGDHVDLVAVGGDPTAPEGVGRALARDLGRGRVVAIHDEGISVAVHRTAVAAVLESLAVGTVELVTRP